MISRDENGYPVVWKAKNPRRDPSEWEPTDLAYLAGLMDGDGNFTIALNKRTGTLKVVIRISLTDEGVTNWCQERFGGTTDVSIWKASSQRPVDCLGFRWSAYGQEAVDATKAFRKYLVIKPAEADLVIEAWENRAPQWGGGRGHHPPVSEETRALRQSYVDRLQQLRAARKASLRLTHPLSRDTL